MDADLWQKVLDLEVESWIWKGTLESVMSQISQMKTLISILIGLIAINVVITIVVISKYHKLNKKLNTLTINENEPK